MDQRRSRAQSLGTAALVVSVVLTMVAVPATGAAEEQLTKTGVDVQSGSSGSVGRGHDIGWAVSTTNIAGHAIDTTVTDLIQGAGTVQAYVPGSLQVPPGFVPGWSTDGGSSYAPTDQGTATNGVQANNPLFGSPSTAVGQLLVPPLRGLVQPTGGDGLMPILLPATGGPSQIWNIYHHTRGSIVCTDAITASPCPGGPWPKSISTDPLPFGTGTSDVYSVTENTVVPDPTRPGVVWETVFKTTGATSVGQLCIDLNTQSTCGYTVLVTPAGAGAVALAEPVIVGSRIYTARPPGAVMLCFDVNLVAACAGQPYPLPAMAGTGFTVAPAVAGKVFGFTYGPVSGGNRMEAWCFDTSSNAACPNWAAPKNVLVTPDPFFAHGPRFATYDSSGSPNGVCVGSSHGTAPNPPSVPYGFAFQCFDIDGNAVTVPNIQWADNGLTGIGAIVSLEALEITAPNGHPLTFFPFNAIHGGIAVRNGGSLCYDWRTSAPCQASNTGIPGYVRYTNVNGGNTRDYGYAYDGQCMFGLGDTGQLFSFDPTTGSSPCGKTHTTITLDAPAFYCDGKPGHVRSYDAVVLADISLSTVDFARTSVTIASSRGAVLGTFGFDPTSGKADISQVPASTTPIVATINLAVFDASSFTSSNQPKGTVSFVGDAPQICFRTTVVTDCSVTTVSNQATGTFTDASGTTTASSRTVTLPVDPSATAGANAVPACPGDGRSPPATPTLGTVALTG